MSKVTGKVIFYYVQSLLGIGHLKRALLIAASLEQRDLKVIFISGGKLIEGMDLSIAHFQQLDPIYVNEADYTNYVTAYGNGVTEEVWEKRWCKLRDLFISEKPDYLLIESYPFGRNFFSTEIEGLIELAHLNKTPVGCSVRDLLAYKSEKRSLEIFQNLESHFSDILVHSDPNFIPLELSFSKKYCALLGSKIQYTGYVVDEAQQSCDEKDNYDIVVSCGGGAVGSQLILHLFELAEGFLKKESFENLKWLFLLGSNSADDVLAELQGKNISGIVLKKHIANFRSVLSQAKLSISQAGYNTLMDVVVSKVPAIFVPFETDKEREQRERLTYLQPFLGCKVLSLDELTSDVIEEVLKSGRKGLNQDFRIDLKGAYKTADYIQQRVGG